MVVQKNKYLPSYCMIAINIASKKQPNYHPEYHLTTPKKKDNVNMTQPKKKDNITMTQPKSKYILPNKVVTVQRSKV